jgi:uncharacterized membrane protein
MYSKARLEALSDGIFAIAMTLLILDLKIPTDVAPGQLWHALAADRESWLAFLITFGISSRYWMLQHNVFRLTDKVHHHAALATFVFLGLVTVLPFSSALVGHHGSEPVGLSLYCANQSAIGMALLAKLESLRRHNRIVVTPEVRYLRARLYSLSGVMASIGIAAWIVPVRYVICIPLVFMVVSRWVMPKKPVYAE